MHIDIMCDFLVPIRSTFKSCLSGIVQARIQTIPLRGGGFSSHQPISQRAVRTSFEKLLDPSGSNCFSREICIRVELLFEEGPYQYF